MRVYFLFISGLFVDRRKFDVCFLLHSSSSSGNGGDDGWKAVLRFVCNVVETFDIGPYATNVAVVTLNSPGKSNQCEAKIKLNDNYGDKLIEEIISIPQYEGERLEFKDGLENAISILERSRRRGIAVPFLFIMTNGRTPINGVTLTPDLETKIKGLQARIILIIIPVTVEPQGMISMEAANLKVLGQFANSIVVVPASSKARLVFTILIFVRSFYCKTLSKLLRMKKHQYMFLVLSHFGRYAVLLVAQSSYNNTN